MGSLGLAHLHDAQIGCLGFKALDQFAIFAVMRIGADGRKDQLQIICRNTGAQISLVVQWLHGKPLTGEIATPMHTLRFSIIEPDFSNRFFGGTRLQGQVERDPEGSKGTHFGPVHQLCQFVFGRHPGAEIKQAFDIFFFPRL